MKIIFRSFYREMILGGEEDLRRVAVPDCTKNIAA